MTNTEQTQIDTMVGEGSPMPADECYPIQRCKHLRAMCMVQARKARDAGLKASVTEWLGHAEYWHVRVVRRDLSCDECQALVYATASRREARRQARKADVMAVVDSLAMSVSP